MRYVLGLTLTGLASAPAAAASVDLTVALPQLKVAEYHKPYVAIWIEGAGQPARNLAIWYDKDKPKNEGAKWLRDVRSWWRKTGRTLSPEAIAGISGATRAPGPQKASFAPAQVGALPPGNYVLNIEAAREVGGRELIALPFAWNGRVAQTVKAAGKTELGAISATIKP